MRCLFYGLALTVCAHLCRLALCWWREVLRLDLEQLWEWNKAAEPWIHIYADARGSPPRIAAVMFRDGSKSFCDCEPPEKLLRQFKSRSDQQIMGLEMLSLALALSSFAPWIQGRRVILWSDNTGAETAAREGTAKQFDHTCLAHCLWSKLAQLKTEAFIRRVPSEFNVADLPSRGEYQLLQEIGASRVKARLDPMFWRLGAWESLRVVSQLASTSVG